MISQRRIATGTAAAAFVLAFALPAFAAWGVDPVTVTSATASIPLVEGCSDGAQGSFVAWQEGSALRAQHLKPNGDLDPAWPAAGAVASNVVAARSELVALPDRLGGLYLVSKEGATLYATRLGPGGAVAAGWPAGGRSLGPVQNFSPRPAVIEDGAHGFYAIWVTTDKEVVGVHLGPSNTGAGGWVNGALPISNGYPDEFALWAQAAPAPDGGVFVAWASYGQDGNGFTPGYWNLKRLTPAGETASGWPAEALSLGDFHYEYIGNWPTGASLLALEEDGRGGAFLMKGNPTAFGPQAPLETRLYRVTGNGQAAADWPAGGVVVPHAVTNYAAAGSDPDDSYRLLSDRRDGVFVGAFHFATDNGSRVDFKRCSSGAQFADALPAWGPQGYEIAARGDGGIFLAYFGCCFYVYQIAYIQLAQFPIASGVYEEHTESFGTWYGDLGLARTDDGGAVFFWSQEEGRVGLFAVRVNAAGAVTGVDASAKAVLDLSRLRFVRGAGVRATISMPGPGSGRFELFDLAGRRLASQAIEPGAREVTIAGTAALPSGLYFGRLSAGERGALARLIVAR